MKLFLDQDVYGVAIKFLNDEKHDLILASEAGMSRADDEILLKAAQEQERIFVTRDGDFGNLVFVKGLVLRYQIKIRILNSPTLDWSASILACIERRLLTRTDYC